jgi:hypothetical protein
MLSGFPITPAGDVEDAETLAALRSSRAKHERIQWISFRGDGFDNLRCYCVSCGSFLPLCLSSDRVTSSSACGASRAFSLSHKTRTSSPHARPCLVCLLSFHAKHGSPARRSSDLVSATKLSDRLRRTASECRPGAGERLPERQSSRTVQALDVACPRRPNSERRAQTERHIIEHI